MEENVALGYNPKGVFKTHIISIHYNNNFLGCEVHERFGDNEDAFVEDRHANNTLITREKYRASARGGSITNYARNLLSLLMKIWFCFN